MAQTVKYLPTMWETRVQSLGQEDPLEKEMTIHSRTLGWRILVGYSLWGRKELDTTERLTLSVFKRIPPNFGEKHTNTGDHESVFSTYELPKCKAFGTSNFIFQGK